MNQIKNEIENFFSKIGGENKVIQVDETAICRGKIISNPTSTYDDIPGTTWLVGDIIEYGNKVFLKIVPDKISETMLNLFKEYVIVDNIIRTEGWASYRYAVRDFGSIHHIVNHSVGITNELGQHTNKIENL